MFMLLIKSQADDQRLEVFHIWYINNLRATAANVLAINLMMG